MSNIEKSYCKRCDFETNHEILHKESIRSDYEEGYDCAVEYMILKCKGCERISFREVFYDLEVSYPDQDGNWQPEITVTTYPEELKVKKKLEKTYELPEKIKLIYDEAINAYNAKCYILTGVAFRAVIEAICIEEKITGSNLEKKINNLVKQKLITEKEANRLHSIRFMGNDSVHEMKVPKERSLETVLNIINHLLNNLYLIDSDSDGVLETIIVQFQDFERLLNKCVQKLNPGDEVPLAKILSKDVRRLNGKIADYERELIEKINNDEYKKLEIGKVDSYGNDSTQRQHFKIK